MPDHCFYEPRLPLELLDMAGKGIHAEKGTEGKEGHFRRFTGKEKKVKIYFDITGKK
jgi:hypothetical protein